MATSSKPSLPTASIAVALLLIAGAMAAGASDLLIFDGPNPTECNGIITNVTDVAGCGCYNHSGNGSYRFSFRYKPAVVYHGANCDGYAETIANNVECRPATFGSVQIFCPTSDHSHMLAFHGKHCHGIVNKVDDSSCHDTTGAKSYLFAYSPGGDGFIYDNANCSGYAKNTNPMGLSCNSAEFNGVYILRPDDEDTLIRKVVAAV